MIVRQLRPDKVNIMRMEVSLIWLVMVTSVPRATSEELDIHSDHCTTDLYSVPTRQKVVLYHELSINITYP